MPSENHSTPGPSALALPVIRPIPARTLVAGMSVIILLAAVFSYFVEVPRREYMTGQLEPFGGEIKVLALHSGTVTGLSTPGTDLDRGELVATIIESPSGSTTQPSTVQAEALKQVPRLLANRHDLVAPVNATVLSNAATNGSTVLAGQPLSLLSVRDAPMQAVLFVPSRALAHLQPGALVQLRLAAYPYETYGPVQAIVEKLELTALSAEQTQAVTGSHESVFRATARVLETPDRTADGMPVRLQSGMQLSASVEVERRTLLAWIVWPLLRQFN